MLKAKFVEAQIISWLQDTRPNLINPVEFYPVLARKIIEALEEYRSICSVPEPKRSEILDDQFYESWRNK